MLRVIRGYDISDPIGVYMMHDLFGGQSQAGMVPGRPGPANGGPIGQAFWPFSTGFGEILLYDSLGAGNTLVGFHVDWKMSSNSGTQQADVIDAGSFEWFRCVHPTMGTLLALFQNTDGTWEVRGPASTVLGTTTQHLHYDTWYSVRAKFGFAGGGGWEIWIDDVRVAHSGSPAAMVSPDRAGFRWGGFGPPAIAYDNYAMFDQDSSDGFNDFFGRVRITGMFAASNQGALWTPFPSATAPYITVRDLPFSPSDANGAPDGDASYLTAESSPQLLTVSESTSRAQSSCYGRILAIGLNAVARPISSAQAIDLLAMPRQTLRVLGTRPVANAGTQYTGGFMSTAARNGYRTAQVISTKSPDTAQFWTDREISGGFFGVRLGTGASAGLQRVTQVYLDKMVSLEGLSYDCGGGGSYAF